jgi:hypothetical protein
LQGTGPDKPRKNVQTADERLDLANIRTAVTDYVEHSKWDTLNGKAFHMGSHESRQEFIDFLTKHIEGVMQFERNTNQNPDAGNLRAQLPA